jgi:hypothetical protein
MVTTDWNYPDIMDQATAGLIKEIGRIKDHKGADLVFTLLNDVKLLAWKNAIPQCEKWAAEKQAEIDSKRARYGEKK